MIKVTKLGLTLFSYVSKNNVILHYNHAVKSGLYKFD